MAQDSIIGSLFGLTPEAYQEAQRRQELQDITNFAKLDPYERASVGYGIAARGLGRAIGGLIGAEDPQLKMVTQQQQILRGVDPNDPVSLANASRLASEVGNPRLAAALAEQSRKTVESRALVAQRLRERQAADPFNKLVESGKYTPESLAIYRESGNIADLKRVEPEKPEARSEIEKLLSARSRLDPVRDKETYDALSARINILTTRAPGASVSVNVPPQEKAFEGELGKVQAKRIGESLKQAESARNSLQTLTQARNILSQPIFTGPLANFQAQYGAALQSLGVKLSDNAVENTQAYGALMAKQTAEIIKNFGAGTGLSDADREYALKAAGGNITMTKDALLRIIDINERAARNSILSHNKKVAGIKTNVPLSVELPSAGWKILK